MIIDYNTGIQCSNYCIPEAIHKIGVFFTNNWTIQPMAELAMPFIYNISLTAEQFQETESFLKYETYIQCLAQ